MLWQISRMTSITAAMQLDHSVVYNYRITFDHSNLLAGIWWDFHSRGDALDWPTGCNNHRARDILRLTDVKGH